MNLYLILLYPPDSIQWIQWITHEYAAATTVCRDFLATPIEARVLQVDFSNLQDMFIAIKSCLGIFLASFWKTRWLQGAFLCQLTCQSADIMSSLCGVGVRVRVNNFFSKTTRPRDMLFFLKDTLSIEDEKLFKA